MSSHQLIVALIAVACVSGCVYPPAKDKRTGVELLGPISMGTTRQPVMGGCYTTFMLSGGCDLVFTDRFGRHVDGHRLARELDCAEDEVIASSLRLNWSAHADTQHRVVATR